MVPKQNITTIQYNNILSQSNFIKQYKNIYNNNYQYNRIYLSIIQMEISAMLDSENIQDYQGSDTDSYDSPVVQFIQDVQIEPQPTNLIIRYQPPLIEQQLLKTFKRLPQNCFDRILNKQ